MRSYWVEITKQDDGPIGSGTAQCFRVVKVIGRLDELGGFLEPCLHAHACDPTHLADEGWTMKGPISADITLGVVKRFLDNALLLKMGPPT